MKHTNNCNYCKHKFKFKFPYRNWSQIAKTLYDRSVERFEPVETIMFMFEGKSWIFEDKCNDYKPNEKEDSLLIELVARLTNKQAKEIEKTENRTGYLISTGYMFPDEEPPLDREIKALKNVSTCAGKKDLSIVIDDVFGSGSFHYCGVTSIKGCKNVEIILKEAWSGKRG